MKQIKPLNIKRPKITRKIKLIVISFLVAVIALAAVFYYALMGIDAWFQVNELVFNRPVTVTFKRPIEVKQKEIKVAEVIKVMESIPHPDDLETPVEKYIYEVFGIEDYKIALAIAKSESGLREDAIGINTNGTVDIGIFQINSIHYKKDGCSLAEVSTAVGNINCAKQIYDSSGWFPWVVFNTGAFKNKLD